MGHIRFHVCILQCLFNIPLKFIWLGPKCSWKKLAEIFYSSISLCFLLIFSKLSKVWICIFYLPHIPDFLNARKWTNKLVMKIAYSWIKLKNAKGSHKFSLQFPPFYILFHPTSLTWKRIPAALPNHDLWIFKMPGSKPGVKASQTDFLHYTDNMKIML